MDSEAAKAILGLSKSSRAIAVAVILGGLIYGAKVLITPPRPTVDKAKALAGRVILDGGSSSKGRLEKAEEKTKDFFPRFLHIMKILFSGRDRNSTIATLGTLTVLLVLRTLLSIQVAVSTGDVAHRIVTMDWPGFLRSVAYFSALGVPAAVVNSGLRYCSQMISLRFTRSLTEHINNQYIVGVNFYKATQLPATRIENVDQRVTADVEAFCTELGDLYTSIFKPVLDIVLNTIKLSSYMGYKAPVVLFSYYLLLARIKMTLLKTLQIKANTVIKSELQGDYRTAHSRLITYAEEIAFFEGDRREKDIISTLYQKLFRHSSHMNRLHAIVGVLDQYLAKYGSSITGYALLCLPAFFPQSVGVRTEGDLARDYVLNRQLLMDLAGGIGTLLQVSTTLATFSGLTVRVSEVIEQVQRLSLGQEPTFTIEPMPPGEPPSDDATTFIAEWRTRCDARRAVRQASPNQGPASKSFQVGDTIQMRDVTIVSPDGRLLVEGFNLEVPHGTNIMVTGPNGCGKSSMFRVLGGLWPQYKGTVVHPPKEDLVFVPQKPYLVMGTLRDQIIYPHTEAEMKANGVTDADLLKLLNIVDPARSITNAWTFNDVRNWFNAFSGGQKQRIAMARVFYHCPRYAILDECTSAVSSEVEDTIYNSCRALGITLFTVSHRPNLQKYHDAQIRFDGLGHYWVYTTEEVLTQGVGQK